MRVSTPRLSPSSLVTHAIVTFIPSGGALAAADIIAHIGDLASAAPLP